MRGKEEVLALLGELLANELTAINQYLLHAETCADWGYLAIAEKLRGDSDGERKHAAMLIERILFLEGAPDLGRYHPIAKGATVKELFERDLELEYTAIAALEAGIVTSRSNDDNATEDLLTRILVAEQDDTHWLESQLELIRQIGEQTYLAQQLRG